MIQIWMIFHQEGLIMLHKAVITFKPEFNKTFMRYFEVLLERKFINLLRKRQRKYFNEEQVNSIRND